MKWSDEGDAAVAELLPLPRHALHAAGLKFPHPRDGELVEVSSELPPDLARFLTDRM
jgi:23S rRNA-/tRNA-specific pseudouridylate synthase